MSTVTKRELKQKLTTAIADLYLLQVVLNRAVRSGVPPDTTHLVQLDATMKLLRSVLTQLDETERDALEESG